jgi:3-hydroxyisobutyrate dehydrogenase-like beta-hydroxyacid dehydrogenase
MGLPVCGTLRRAGFDVVAADVDPNRRPHVERVGARWASSLVDASDGVEVLITVLPGSGGAA